MQTGGGASLEARDLGLGKQARWTGWEVGRQGGARREVGCLERQRPLGLGKALGLRLEARRPEEAPLP